MCSSTLSVNCEKVERAMQRYPDCRSPISQRSHVGICARLSKGKGEIYKRVENRRLSTLLYARAASAHSPPRGAANPRRPQTANPLA